MKNGKVYFIGCNKMGIKIGYTKNDPIKRLRQLQTGCPYKLKLLYVINGADKETEAYYHRYFSNLYNVRGEFYDYKFVLEWIQRRKLEQEVLKKEDII